MIPSRPRPGLGLRRFWGEAAHGLAMELEGRPTFQARVAALEDALERRIPDRLPGDEELQAIVEETRSRPGHVRVATLASSSGLSRQRFTRWFRDAVGMGPKRFARLLRLQAVLESVTTEPVGDWSRFALRPGYCDQAHMIADFRWLTGLPPGRFVAIREAVARPVEDAPREA